MAEAPETTDAPEAPAPVEDAPTLPSQTDPLTPAAQDTAPAEPAPESPEPASPPPPDTSDAMSHLAEIRQGLQRAGFLGNEEGSVYDRLSGQPEDDGYEDYYEPQPDQQQAGQMSEAERYEQQINQRIEERAREAVLPYLESIEQERREERILAFADEHPDFNKPEVVDAVAGHLDVLANRYGNPHIRTDPQAVQMAYFAYVAQQAAQTSPSGELEGQGPAEAGAQGATIETGAGPSAPPPEVDPQEAMYQQAIQGERNDFATSPHKSP